MTRNLIVGLCFFIAFVLVAYVDGYLKGSL